jgi:hypothetical protein
MRVFKISGVGCINADNDSDAERIQYIYPAAIEMDSMEITSVFGEFVAHASPTTTSVDNDGTVNFDVSSMATKVNTDLSTTVRAKRDALLASSDWTQLADCVLDDADKVLWQSYRRALRDVPQQTGFPNSVTWPNKPE